jgi:hypothetical protein
MRELSMAVSGSCGVIPRLSGWLSILHSFLLILLFLLFLFCAHKVAPGGGPEDKIPPEIVKHFPAADSVGIKNLEYIEIEFNEPIRQSTLLENYWMMPRLEKDFTVKWKGNQKVRFYLNDSLETNQTYVFTLSTNVRDMRNNGLIKPFQIAFSTGSMLDRGSVSGQVYADQKPRDVFIYAYRIDPGTRLDSLIYREPHYYTQPDANGAYRLSYLALEKYRLIALVDQDYDKVYTIESDQIGLPSMDIQLDSSNSHFVNINFYLLQEDTTRPLIREIDTMFNRQLRITFSEKVMLDSTFRIMLSDSLNGDTLQVMGSSFAEENGDQLQIFFSGLPAARKISLQLQGIADLAGNKALENLLNSSFVVPNNPDTAAPKLLEIVPAFRQTEVLFDAPVIAKFSVPVDSNSYKKSLQLTDQDSTIISGHFDFKDLYKPVFKPQFSLKSNTSYHIRLNLSSLRDLWQRSFLDTVIIQEFTVQDLANLGEMSGQVTSGYHGQIQAIVEVSPLRGNQVYQALTNSDQNYQLQYLPEGNFLVKSILDLNRNGRWDKGAAAIWEFSEPFFFRPDTIKIRRRWTTEGINIDFNFQGTE